MPRLPLFKSDLGFILYALVLILLVGTHSSSAETNNAKLKAQYAAFAFRALVSEGPALAEPVLRKMPIGLIEPKEKWSSPVQAAWSTYFSVTKIHIGQTGTNKPSFLIFIHLQPPTPQRYQNVYRL